ncbi:low-density lipoprotein receptor-related protein 4-like isoform X2 [Portunus trituberculatus]|nr:low-density lipoprotein receptor-related protein 4-like isoform X2 [Portunus trituberculatus]
MVCGSKMGKKQAVEPFEWWPDEEEPCPPDQWRCRDDKECIPRSALCSNATECEDGSDESPRFCGCKKDQFRCGDRCILCSQLCDKVEHCDDGEDERDCLTHTCPSNFFQCESDGICVPQRALCNHTTECADGSDENNCQSFRTCYHLEFRCDNGQCVRPYSVCDGRTQCKDGSDEKDCQPSDFVTCKSGRKVHKFWHCNNFPDCSEKYYDDDTDELHCPCDETHFRCNNTRCIYKGNVCDSKCDCQGCEDEVNCSHVYTSDSGVVECLKGKSVECSGRCIAREFL